MNQKIRQSAFVAAGLGGLVRGAVEDERPRSATVEYTHRLRVRFAGRTLGLSVRGGSTDAERAKQILHKQGSYALPAVVRPRLIADVGAGVGLASVYFSVRYPQASIYCFERSPRCLDLCRANTARHSEQVRVIPVLGPAGVARTFADEHISRVDLIRVDVAVLGMAAFEAVGVKICKLSQAIVGDLTHSDRAALSQLLEPSHTLMLDKPDATGRVPFVAVRRDLAELASSIWGS